MINDQIKLLIVHCSDTPDDIDINARHIHKMHLDFGWDGIGYHKVICRDGLVENGRPEYWIGAHVRGKNRSSLGVCLVGRNKFTKKQYNSLEKVLRQWKKNYPLSRIVGHSSSTETHKTCPNFDVYNWCVERGIN